METALSIVGIYLETGLTISIAAYAAFAIILSVGACSALLDW